MKYVVFILFPFFVYSHEIKVETITHGIAPVVRVYKRADARVKTELKFYVRRKDLKYC